MNQFNKTEHLVETTFTSDGQRLEYQKYEVDSAVCAIHFLHGMSEHIGRYHEMCEWFNAHRINVYLHHHRGSGYNFEHRTRGHFNHIDELIDDCITMYDEIIPNDLPTVLMGHSMGSIIARNVAIQHPNLYNGYIFVGTSHVDGLSHSLNQSILKGVQYFSNKQFHPMINRLNFLTYNIPYFHEFDRHSWLNSSRNMTKSLNDDPHFGYIMSTKSLDVIESAMHEASQLENINQMDKRKPVLFIAGKGDTFAHRGQSIRLLAERMKQAGLEEVFVQLYSKSRHEVLFEQNKVQVYDNIRQWINDKLIK